MVPRDAGHEAEDGGEVGVVKVARFLVNSSLELMPAADAGGRRRRRCPGHRNTWGWCQDDAQDKEDAE